MFTLTCSISIPYSQVLIWMFSSLAKWFRNCSFSVPLISMGNINTLFSWAPKSLQTVTAAIKLKMFAPWKQSYDKPRHHIKYQRHHFADQGPSSQSCGFSSSHVQMWGWPIKKAERWRINAVEVWCWRRLLTVSWTARRSNQLLLSEINPEYSLERLAETKAPILGPPDVKSRLIGKDPDAGKDWRQNRKGETEDDVVA